MPKSDIVLCNMCGLSCALTSDAGFDLGNDGLIKQVVVGGYNSTPGNGSGALDDMTSYKFSICEFCLDFLFSNFIISPEVYDNSSEYYSQVFISASERVKKDKWRKKKKEFYKEKEIRNKANT